jgi:hypothetical protein
MRDNRFFILLASRQIGKALALDTPILTPSGWTNMGELKAGDKVYGIDGKPCNVVYAHDILTNRECYKLTFDNGETIIADAVHLRAVQDHDDRCHKRPPSKRTTASMAKNLITHTKPFQLNYSIPHTGPIEYGHQSLPIDPYQIGELNLYKNSYIPQIYINSSVEQRLELIRGFMDASGNVEGIMNTFYNTNKVLIHQMQEVLHSLRIKTIVSRYDYNESHGGEIGLPIYKLAFETSYSVFKLPGKKNSQYISSSTHVKNVFIEKIERVDSIPVRCITVDSKEGCFLCGKTNICTSNTTLMTIYALWVACFQKDQSILIVANKEGTAIEIFRRIRLAYEELPNFLKPGVVSYGKTAMELANGCRIGISTTTGTAARGQSINCLILDELGFIEPHLVDEFWKSVYPIVSSSKHSKIFIASTANGTGNLFHTLYTGAENGRNGWACDKILWNEIPGRDDKWKNETIATIGSLDAFNQEFNCEFLDSGESSVNEDLYDRLSIYIKPPLYVMEDGHYQVWEEPKDDRLYVAGVDVSEGIDKDASVIQIVDMTDLTNMRQVACYHNNNISPINFTVKLNEILTQWGKPLACIERNNCGAQVIDNLRHTHGYDSIVSWGASTAGRLKDQLGIVVHTNTKHAGILNMRYWVNQLEVVQIRDINLLKEFKSFVRHSNGTWSAKKGAGFHDDRVMSFIWSLIVLEKALVETLFEVIQYDVNNRPLIIKQLDFGIKYYTSPGSIYNDKDGGNSALPSLMNDSAGGFDEIEMLYNQGYRPLQ